MVIFIPMVGKNPSHPHNRNGVPSRARGFGTMRFSGEEYLRRNKERTHYGPKERNMNRRPNCVYGLTSHSTVLTGGNSNVEHHMGLKGNSNKNVRMGNNYISSFMRHHTNGCRQRFSFSSCSLALPPDGKWVLISQCFSKIQWQKFELGTPTLWLTGPYVNPWKISDQKRIGLV